MIKRSGMLLAGAFFLASIAQAETIALQNARIMTAGEAGTIERGTVLIKDGKIAAVGEAVRMPAEARTVDLQGRTLTPGLIATDTLLGMVEISGGADAAETSSRTKRVSAGYDVQYAINPFSTAIPVARKGGVTRAVVMPNAGAEDATFAGQAAVLSLEGGEQAERQPGVAVVWDMRIKSYGRGATFVQLTSDLEDVRTYMRDPSSLNKGGLVSRDWTKADLEALVPVVKGDVPLAVRVNRASDILTLIEIARQEKLRIVLIGITEGWRVAGKIAEAGIPVVLDPTDNLPGSFDEIGVVPDNAARLHAAGVTVILRGGAASHDAGKLRYMAGLAVARGLPAETALKAVTSVPAKVWGLKKQGELLPGNVADIAVWNGDPFEPMTELQSLYINGQAQDLVSRQDALQTRYIFPAGSKNKN